MKWKTFFSQTSGNLGASVQVVIGPMVCRSSQLSCCPSPLLRGSARHGSEMCVRNQDFILSFV